MYTGSFDCDTPCASTCIWYLIISHFVYLSLFEGDRAAGTDFPIDGNFLIKLILVISNKGGDKIKSMLFETESENNEIKRPKFTYSIFRQNKISTNQSRFAEFIRRYIVT